MKIRFILFFCFLQFSIFNLQSSFAQSGTWTWISGSNVPNDTAIYGTQGIPSVYNHPPALYEAAEWKDKQGNFWIYAGGGSFDLSDLWKYDPVANEWTWMKGDGIHYIHPVYGTQGVSSPSNTPGSRGDRAIDSWVDTSGTFWLFGGDGNSNDLWKYDIGTNEWTWVTGDTILDVMGVYGTQGIPSPLNAPGARSGICSQWTDSLNNLWLFGGEYVSGPAFFNDLWKYNIADNEWTWMKGADTANSPPNYGIKGITATTNDPGARSTSAKWKDLQGNFWFMGDFSLGDGSCTNDVWKYDLSVNEWTWMNGSDVANNTGNYVSNCAFNTTNLPESRAGHTSSTTDNCGRFWLFGGENSIVVGNATLNDLWVFDPEELKWNWINGSDVPNQQGNYGTLGVASPSNIPPSRVCANAWWGNDNKFYMFAGVQPEIEHWYSDLWVFTPDTNCIPSSSCNSVVVAPVIANFQTSQTTLCAYDCINFTDLSTNATSWQWTFAGATDSTSTLQNPQNVCYTAAGSYNVTLVATNAGGSDWVTFTNYINVKPAPPTPTITQVGNTLYCSSDTSYKSYQWYLDSVIIAGATDSSLVISKSGNYNVQVSSGNGCKIAVGINIIIGIQNYMSDNVVSLFPNPVGDKFTVYGLRFTVSHIEILNVLGQVCEQSAITNLQSEIDVSSLSSGIYFVQISNESGRWVGKFVKE